MDSVVGQGLLSGTSAGVQDNPLQALAVDQGISPRAWAGLQRNTPKISILDQDPCLSDSVVHLDREQVAFARNEVCKRFRCRSAHLYSKNICTIRVQLAPDPGKSLEQGILKR